MIRLTVFLAVATALALAGAVSADENVREVQNKLHDAGLYSGEIDGAYSTELSAALTRYQSRNGLPISGQLDVETAKALGAKPAVGPSTAAAEQSSSETWRRLRKGERRTSTSAHRSETAVTEARQTPTPRKEETSQISTGTAQEESAQGSPPQSSEMAKPMAAAPATAAISSETATPGLPPAAVASDTSSSAPAISTERLRDYVAAFVLAGLDKNIGAETEFFADRVQYYDQGIMDRENIREDLKRYDEQWPERHFWIAGTINVEPQSDNRVQVTFPLGYKLRNGNRILNGKVEKTLLLESAGDDLQIVAVNEHKAR